MFTNHSQCKFGGAGAARAGRVHVARGLALLALLGLLGLIVPEPATAVAGEPALRDVIDAETAQLRKRKPKTCSYDLLLGKDDDLEIRRGK